MTTTRRTFLQRSAAAGAGLVAAGGLGSVLSASARAADAAKPSRSGSKRLLILGGTAYLGPEVVEAAQKRGWTITLFNRGKTNPGLFPDLEKLHGDRKDDLESLKGRDWDYVVDTSGYVPGHVSMSAELLRDRVKQYVFVSTISVYGNEVPKVGMTEQDAVAPMPEGADPEKVTGLTYGPLKALCEKAAEDAMPGRATNIRPGLIVGPGDPTDRYTYWPVRVAKGGEVLAPGTPRDPVQMVDVRDLAEFIVRTLEDGSVGVYNATGPAGGMPIGEMLEACKRAAGSDARFLWADAEFLEAQQIGPWQDMPTWVPPVGAMAGFSRIDVSKAVSKGLRFRPHEETARDTLAWWKEQPEARRGGAMKAGLTPEREAAAIAALKARKP